MGRLALPSSGAIQSPDVCSLAFTTHISAPSLPPPRLSHSRRLDVLSGSYYVGSTSPTTTARLLRRLALSYH